MAAGLPESVPALTLDRKCGSGQQAMEFAAQGVIAGAYGAVIAGGVEMMSLLPMRANRMGRDAEGARFKQRYPEGLVSQGIAAELIAARWHITREAMDSYALRSHRLALEAGEADHDREDIVPVEIDAPHGRTVVNRDDGPRRDTSMERLSMLRSPFENAEMQRRFPEIGWGVTAGNASQLTDGAGAALIMEEQAARRAGLVPRAAITHFAVVGDDPLTMLTGVIPATRKLLTRAALKIDDIDAFEVNEAFASVALAWLAELDAPIERLNALGGAIALGHPLGASGIRLMANLLRSLETTRGRFGLQTMCESGGMANALLIERA